MAYFFSSKLRYHSSPVIAPQGEAYNWLVHALLLSLRLLIELLFIAGCLVLGTAIVGYGDKIKSHAVVALRCLVRGGSIG